MFSGIQPSGDLTLDNYLGAIKNWVKLQDEYENYFCIVDMHAITVRQEPKNLRRRTLELLAIYLAAGIDPEKSTIFIQSHVPAHSEAAWILCCNAYMGELGRMTQYKDKSKKTGAKIMSLQDPTSKMSKSDDNPNSFILIMDPPEVIRKKISRAVTDSLGVVKYSDDQPGVKNLMTILSSITGMSFDEIEKKYEGQGYAQFKKDVAEAIAGELEPIQKKVNELLKDKSYLEGIYKKGAEKASYVANKTLRKMQRKIGFIEASK